MKTTTETFEEWKERHKLPSLRDVIDRQKYGLGFAVSREALETEPDPRTLIKEALRNDREEDTLP